MVQSGQIVSVSLVGATETVTINGTLMQGGQFGRVDGTFSTSAGDGGSVVLFEINGQQDHWTARLGMISASRSRFSTGYLGGIRQ